MACWVVATFVATALSCYFFADWQALATRDSGDGAPGPSLAVQQVLELRQLQGVSGKFVHYCR